MANSDILFRLEQTLLARKGAEPNSSYVASLYAKGLDTILKKVGEEATEAVIAAKGGDRKQLTAETADLIFHTLVMLAAKDVPLADVLAELERREGISGITEKTRADTLEGTGDCNMTSNDTIFGKIIRGEIPAKKVYEDDEVLAIHDIHPVADVHFLIIPKKFIPTLVDASPDDAVLLGKMLVLAPVLARQEGLTDGFRTSINTGRMGRQDVYHLHIHVFGNRPGGVPLSTMAGV